MIEIAIFKIVKKIKFASQGAFSMRVEKNNKKLKKIVKESLNLAQNEYYHA